MSQNRNEPKFIGAEDFRKAVKEALTDEGLDIVPDIISDVLAGFLREDAVVHFPGLGRITSRMRPGGIAPNGEPFEPYRDVTLRDAAEMKRKIRG